MSLEFDGSQFLANLDRSVAAGQRAAQSKMSDSIDDLALISQNIAPVDSGTLRRTVAKSVRSMSGAMEGTISFSATESSAGYGRFNYALWTHEYMGDGQVSSPGSYRGYTVGAKYLSRPLEGERARYMRDIANAVKEAIG